MPTVVNALGEHCECAQLGLNFDIWLEDDTVSSNMG